MTKLPCVVSEVRYGPARSNRGKVCPVGQLNGLSPHSRAPFPENWTEVNGEYSVTSCAMPNVWPLSVEATNAAPFTEPVALLNAPPVPPCRATSTWPEPPKVIEGPWLLQMPPEIFSGALNVAPWSVDRLMKMLLQPLPWKSDHDAYT